MIIGSHYSVRKIDLLGIPLMLFPIFYFDDNWINDIEPKLLCLTGVALILISDNNESLLSRISKMKIVSLLGLSSYSLYLFHQPFFAFFRIISESFNREINNFGKFTMLLFLMFISYLNYKKIELKFINNKNSKYLFRFVLKYIIFLLIFSTSVIVSDGLSFLYSDKDYRAESGGIERFQGQLLGSKNIPPSFIVVGDSHAGHFLRYLDEQGKKYNFSFNQFTYSNCLSLINYTNTYKFGIEGYEDCVTLFEQSLKKAREFGLPIIYSNVWTYDLRENNTGTISKWEEREHPFDLIRDELIFSISEIENGEIIIVGKTIGSLNQPFSKPVKCSKIDGNKMINIYVFEFADKFDICKESQRTKINIEINNQISQSVKDYPNLSFIDPSKLYCNSETCYDYISGEYIYYADHLTYRGSEIIVNEIISKLGLTESP